MIKALLVVWLVMAVAIGLAAALVPSVDINGGFITLLGVALLFGLVNAVIGPIFHLLTAPLNAVTFGIVALLVNGVLLALTAGLSSGLDVGGFFSCVVAAILISVFATLIALGIGLLADDGSLDRQHT